VVTDEYKKVCAHSLASNLAGASTQRYHPDPMIRLLRSTLFVFAIALAIAGPLAAQSGANPNKTALSPGDRLLLKLYVDSSFNYSDAIIIDQATRVVLPRLGSVSLQGVPAESVADSVRSAYASILRTRAIDVVPLRRVGIVGDVRKPDVYYIDLTTNLRDAIALAGGVAEIGRPDNVSIIRNGVTTRVKDWESSASVWSELVSGDEILVGRQSFFERNAIAVITGVSVFASIVFTLARK
jgi:protein involved in polysaccharide export with SLBB domain